MLICGSYSTTKIRNECTQNVWEKRCKIIFTIYRTRVERRKCKIESKNKFQQIKHMKEKQLLAATNPKYVGWNKHREQNYLDCIPTSDANDIINRWKCAKMVRINKTQFFHNCCSTRHKKKPRVHIPHNV